ncbi:MAG: antibiotic biosynthesis monooxygenase, partial [Actinomycetes bacterium]
MPDVLPDAATAVVNVRVRPGRDRDFLTWQERMSDVVRQRSGYLSTSVVTPTDPTVDDFVIIHQFASATQLKAWMDSPERRGMLSEILGTVVDSEATSVVMGGALRRASTAPVTAVITVRVRDGAHQQFRDWQRRMAELMATQTGHLGTNIQEPITGLQDEWVIMTRFDSEEHLSAWMTSR